MGKIKLIKRHQITRSRVGKAGGGLYAYEVQKKGGVLGVLPRSPDFYLVLSLSVGLTPGKMLCINECIDGS